MNIVLFGMPTAGKGTQAELLSKEYNIPHISTGDILREEMANKTPLGLQIDDIMRAGGLAPDGIVNNIIVNKLNKLNGWIFDGYPRSINQAILFKSYIDTNNVDVKFFFININENLVWERSHIRLLKENRFEDASDDVIKKRIDVFYETTQRAIEFFSHEKNFRIIDGNKSINDIFYEIKTLIKGR